MARLHLRARGHVVVAAVLIAGGAQAQVTGGTRYTIAQGSNCATGSTADGYAVVVAPCEAGALPQAWIFEDAGGGVFGVRNAATGRYLDVEGRGSEGARVLTWTSNGDPNQRFQAAARGAAYELRPSHVTGQCVAAPGDGSVRLAACSDATNQAWSLDEAPVPDAGPPPDGNACRTTELFQPLAFLENTQGGPTGSNVVIKTHGYLMILFAPDSGRPPGVLHFYDVSDPRRPVLRHRVDDEHTARFREAHSLPIGLVGGKEYVAIQTIDGIQFWDLTNPLEAAFVSQIDLPGVAGGDYDNVAWQADWQGRYLFVAGSNQGIYVVDAGDPQQPRLLAQVPNGRTGGFRVGPLFARGPYLVVSTMDQAGAYSVLDITRPDDPTLLDTTSGLPRTYSMAATGSRIYGAGRDGDFLIHSFSDPTSIEEVKIARIEQDSLYVAPQDGFVFSGRQENFVKIDVKDEKNPVIVGEGTLGREHPDHGQVTPLGNLLFIGNDHGSGSALFCHAERDDLPPAIDAIFPADGSVQQDPGSRITIVFSDFIDTRTIGPTTVAVRSVGGAPLPGIYTYNFNTVSFSADTVFAPNTTYEIALARDGVRDVTGNGLAQDVVARFSTGTAIVAPPPPPPPPLQPDASVGAGGAGAGGAPSGGAGAANPSTTGGARSGGGAAGAPSPTAGAPSAPDAGPGVTPASGGDSGCGCRVAEPAGGADRTLASTLLLLWGLAGRRRSRRCRPDR